jgi:putative Mn2+ efflux pump MntP
MVGGKRMNWMENLLIIAGVSLDIFAAMECQGSLVAKINKKNLTVICGIVALAQLITLYLGHFLSSLFCRYRSVPDEKLLGQIISMVIFMILGIRLMVKAIRNEHVEEHLEHHLGIRRFVRMACISGIYTLLTGIAFGFLETNVLMILIMIVVCTVAFVIGGIYTGYRVGYEAKTKVYIVGALLLWVAGLDVLFGRIL